MKKAATILREARMIARALASTRHPILAHLVPIRRCNLACGYCNEYDKTSDAEFHVSINSVLGGGMRDPEDVRTVARRAVELGFSTSLGIIHDGSGQLKSLNESEAKIYEELKGFGKSSRTRLNQFQDDLAYGRAHNWRCRAGARYCMSAKTALCMFARNNAALPAFRWSNTRGMISRVNSAPKSPAQNSARLPVCSRSPCSTTGGRRRTPIPIRMQTANVLSPVFLPTKLRRQAGIGLTTKKRRT